MPDASPFTDQLTAWSTLSGAIFAAVTVGVAVFALIAGVRAYRTQAEQLELQRRQLEDQQDLNRQQGAVLALQADELRESLAERRREAEERHRAQAIRVFTWTEAPAKVPQPPPPPPGSGPAPSQDWRWFLHIRNASELPIRNVVIHWQRELASAGGAEVVPYLGPGEQSDRERLWAGDADDPGTPLSAVVDFTDADGQQWRLALDGRLHEWCRDEGVWRLVRDSLTS